MKKLFVLLLVLILTISLFAGCAATGETPKTDETPKNATSEKTDEMSMDTEKPTITMSQSGLPLRRCGRFIRILLIYTRTSSLLLQFLTSPAQRVSTIRRLMTLAAVNSMTLPTSAVGTLFRSQVPLA